ncbi:unnamed protein product [Plutella xylostella]|uniref:(diamondback moth) hypothetical protein n=1 Tax=Plutella xylostella TaxID=51655 RepID=A0A8S4G3E3_PLUXY|nr:unnamed protein product [Plutella xylostella]
MDGDPTLSVQLKDELGEVVAELEALDGQDECKQSSKAKQMSIGRKKFNMDPKKGIEYLYENGLLQRTPEDVAQFLHKGEGLSKTAIGDYLGERSDFNEAVLKAFVELHDFTDLILVQALRRTPEDVAQFLHKGEGLSKTAIGDYLGERSDFNEAVLKAFVELHDFTDLILVQALRQFLWSFRLPGEAQKIDRMMECFAQRYCQLNPDIFTNADTCYVLSFAIIMLNTSLHNPSVKDKPTPEQFVAMNRGINNGGDLPQELLLSSVDRVIETGNMGAHLNPDIFTNADTCYVLSFAIIMLNTSLHNPSVKDKPTPEQFVAMNRGINNGGDLPQELLLSLYESIKTEPFKIPEDDGNDLMHTFFNPDKEGWLWKQGGRYKSWKRRWFILNDNCLYYFEYTTDKEPRGIIPLENISVRPASDRQRPHCLELYASGGADLIKACKTDSEGKVVEGKHTVYRPHCLELYASGGADLIKACKTDSEGKMVEGKHTVYR